MDAMTPRPKVASGPLIAQPVLSLAGPVSTSHRATTTTTIRAGEFYALPYFDLESFPIFQYL